MKNLGQYKSSLPNIYFPKGCGPRASSSEPEYINNVGDMHNISRESWREAKQHSKKIDNKGQIIAKEENY